MKTENKTYRGTITEKQILYVGKSDLKHYVISFVKGDIHVFTERPLGVMKGQTIEFNCIYHANMYIASNVKVIRNNTKKFVSKMNKSDKRLLSI